MAGIDFGTTTVQDFLKSILDNGEQLAVAAKMLEYDEDSLCEAEEKKPSLKEITEHVTELITSLCNIEPVSDFPDTIIIGADAPYIISDAPAFRLNLCVVSQSELEYFLEKAPSIQIKKPNELSKTKGTTYYQNLEREYWEYQPQWDIIFCMVDDWDIYVGRRILMESVNYFGRIRFAAELLLALAPYGESNEEEHRANIEATFPDEYDAEDFNDEEDEEYDEDVDYEEDLDYINDRNTIIAFKNKIALDYFTSEENSGANAVSLSALQDAVSRHGNYSDEQALLSELDDGLQISDEEAKTLAYSNVMQILCFVEQIKTLNQTIPRIEVES